MEIYKLARSVDDVKEYLKGAKVISFDFETSPDERYRNEPMAAIDAHKAHIVGVSFSVEEGTGIYAPILLLSFGVWCVIFAIWHYVSLASMIAGCCYPIFVMIFSTTIYDPAAPFLSVPFIIFSWAVGFMLVWTHRKNIERLRDGTESQIHLWGAESTPEKKEEDKQ